MFAKGAAVIQLFEEWVPKSLAVEDDKIGLQLGTLQKEIKKVMVTLEITDEVIDEAIAEKVDLIIAHHAIIFRPLKHLQTDQPAGKRYEKCIKNDIAVYIAHTNLDIAEGGINDMMAEALGISKTKVLSVTQTEPLLKLAVYVPEEHHDKLMHAVMQAGAGHIGAYSHCSFNTEGIGTFLPEEGTKPYVGSQGKLEQVKELRLETIVPERKLKRVVQAMLKAHPYEEPAYDVYPLKLEGKPFGLGRVGKLEQEVTLREFNEVVKKAFDVPMTRVVGDLDRMVRKVAVMGGQGARYMSSAIFQGADVFVTGDIDYHTAQDALAAGMCLIDPGHHTEQIMKSPVAEYLHRRFQEQGYATEVVVSNVQTEPFQFI
ncbi:Nif3-like dinuclear metal center hexameric protein [Marinicrinis lubricantis]|uniref:GTP cyclohydrolase 1 type 2 homolog n=1 Tax=Marinicrinis lubricantis TaxID=2086470 RepID=A0ABW1IUQ3_9BACL